jgi:hypothetical protein
MLKNSDFRQPLKIRASAGSLVRLDSGGIREILDVLAQNLSVIYKRKVRAIFSTNDFRLKNGGLRISSFSTKSALSGPW